MDTFQNLLMGFQVALSLQNLLFCLIGTTIGTLIGVLPGIGPLTGVAILIPITFGMDATTAIITMAGLYYGAMYGGSTTSILINVPGESASVVTMLDGYQMARQGRAGPALGMAALSSFIAGTFAVLALTFMAPPLVKVALAFGPPEYFTLAFMGLTLVTSLGGESMIKGLMSGVFGLILSCVGIDAVSGAARFTYGQLDLLDGFGFIGVTMGLFAVAEVLVNMEEPEQEVYTRSKLNIRSLFPNLQDWKDSFGALWRGSLLGFFCGVLPGGGSYHCFFPRLWPGEKGEQAPGEIWHRSHRRSRCPGGSQQCCCGWTLCYLPDPRHPGERDDGNTDGCFHHPWTATGATALRKQP